MTFTTLISTSQLAEHLEDEHWVVVDCRFDLADSERGHQLYLDGHIPGAVYAHLDRDLAGPITEETGRHPLPDLDEFRQKLGGWGIDGSRQVVVYDNRMGAIAARLWWMLRFLGHHQVAVLDGGIDQWNRENRPLRSGRENPVARTFSGDPLWDMTASVEEVTQRLNQRDKSLIDSRSPERYRGEVEPLDPVAGRIPGAVNRYFGLNVDDIERWRPSEELAREFDELLGSHPPDEVVFYCGSGVTACHNLLALEHLGRPGARLYVGSWSEWIRDPERPQESG